MEYNQEKKQS